MKPRKPHIVVFFGGEAASRDLSSETGYWVCQYIARDAYDVTPVHVRSDGTWQVPLGSLPRTGSVEKMMDYLYRGLTALAPTKALERLLARPVSAFFSVLRGAGGDDGGLHSMGNLLDITVIGSPALACQQTYNKRLSHALLRDLASTPMASFYGPTLSLEAITADIRQNFEPPLFIKPVAQESSAGTEFAETLADLAGAVERARSFGEVMAQERARGTELSLSMIDNGQGEPFLLPPTVVVPRQSQFYDFLAKRRPGRVTLHSPDQETNTLLIEAEAIARDVWDSLGCTGYASMDFVADEASVDLLEVNTVPVLSSATPFLTQLSAGKIHPTAFLDSLVRSSLS